MKTKKYNKTAIIYVDKLLKVGYTCHFNWVGDREYEDVSVTGPLFCGYGCEFSTPQKAYDYIKRFRRY